MAPQVSSLSGVYITHVVDHKQKMRLIISGARLVSVAVLAMQLDVALREEAMSNFF